MTTTTSAPKEVLLNIFRNIESVAQLAQCRLVCKQWDAAAEMAMFGQKITIKTEMQAINLYAHLCKDIRKGMMIRHLHFDLLGQGLPTIYKPLLSLAMNPNMERLTGTIQPDIFFTTLMGIVAKKGIEFSRLKELPTQMDGIHSFAAVQAMVRFKTITTLVYAAGRSNEKIIRLLDGLENLQNLQLQGIFDNFAQLDDILNRLNCLKALELDNFAFGRSPHHRNLPFVPIVDPSTITAVDSLQSIKISFLPGMRPELIEYLTCKYPKLKSFEMKTKELYAEAHLSWSYMKRVLACVEKIPSRNLTIEMQRETHMLDALKLAETSKLLNIQYKVENGTKLIMTVT